MEGTSNIEPLDVFYEAEDQKAVDHFAELLKTNMKAS